MKKTIFLGIALTLATTGAFALGINITPVAQVQGSRQAGTPDERARRQADRINATAQLTPDQYTKVLAIAKDFATQREALKSSGAQGDDLKTKFKALDEQEHTQLKGVLTADQYARVEAARKEHMGDHAK